MIFNIATFEFRRLFFNPLAWIVLAITQLLVALVFYNLLSAYLTQPALFEGQGLTESVVSGFYQSVGVILVLIVPFLTMRLLSEELRSGTMRLLFSSPISVTQIILGKYLGIVLFLFCILILISLIPASLAIGTSLDFGHFIACLLGLVLLMGTLAAIGLFISSLCRYPAVAAISTFALLIMLWTAHAAGNNSSRLLYGIFNYLSISRHYTPFTRGLFNTADLFYFVILCLTCLFLSIWRLDSMRTHHW